MGRYNMMYSYEHGVQRGKNEQRALDIEVIEEAARKFNLDALAINKVIRKIKSGEA
jgi:hypothetical protein